MHPPQPVLALALEQDSLPIQLLRLLILFAAEQPSVTLDILLLRLLLLGIVRRCALSSLLPTVLCFKIAELFRVGVMGGERQSCTGRGSRNRRVGALSWHRAKEDEVRLRRETEREPVVGSRKVANRKQQDELLKVV